ncbi:zf-HC2 domain-containing protein [Bradyrhizobium oligotrophicum S58]
MMALSKMLEQEPGEIELLLPWYAAGTLSPRDMRRVEEALANDADLARQYAEIQKEYAETIALNESLGAPSMRAMQKLFAAIEADPVQKPAAPRGFSARLMDFFDSLSPRTLAWTVSLGALLVLAQAGVIGTVLMRSQTATYQTASVQDKTAAPEPASKPMVAPPPPSAAAPAPAERAPESMTRSRMAEAPAPAAPLIRGLGPQVAGSTAPAYALVRFAPDARMADISALLDSYQASIIEGAKGGLFKLQLGDRPLSKAEADSLIGRLAREKIVSLAVAAQ